MVQIIDDKLWTSQFSSVQQLMLVDFYADWCGPCKRLAPLLEQMEKEFPSVKFLKVNVEESPKLSDEYKISAMPTIIIFFEGKEVERIMGCSPDKIKEALLKRLASCS